MKKKSSRRIDNYVREIQQYLSGKSYRPLTFLHLVETLHIPPQNEEDFKAALKVLEKEGVICKVNRTYELCAEKAQIITGTIRIHHKGFGFVEPLQPQSFSGDIFIPKHFTHHAVDGDTVEVEIDPNNFSEKGPEGKVVAIVKRSRTHLAGTVVTILPESQVQIYSPLLGKDKRVLIQSDEQLQVGDRVVAKVSEWGGKNREATGILSHKIGNLYDPQTDIPATIEEYELREDFPTKVIKEAKRFGTKVLEAEIGKREDFRKLPCVTIDPDTAKDFDDAVSVVEKKEGGFTLYVHIADASHYIQKGSELDQEALLRCNSTYLPGKCLPMLPEELSNHLLSLMPKVDRLTASVIMDFNDEGDLTHYRITRSIICSDQRLTYKQAKALLDSKKRDKTTLHLRKMVKLLTLLKKKRYERGSIEFTLPELVILLDEVGRPYGTEVIEYDITHQMIEEFMLKANETVATHLTLQNKPITYRIHEAPMDENIREFATLANAFGFKVSDKPTIQELQELFEEAAHTPYAHNLATQFIRRMKLAVYSADNVGHYGLALSHYCHFTSPIRRYSDLVVHRALFAESTSFEEIEKISVRCSEQERISAKAEQSVHTLKKLRLLMSYEEKAPFTHYSAVITSIKPFGIFFDIPDVMLEGFIPLHDCEFDYLIFEPSKMQLTGKHTALTFRPGDAISVTLQDIDLIYQTTKWQLMVDVSQKRKLKTPKNRKKKR